jgi:dolichol-phosphate mannosyltransferase
LSTVPELTVVVPTLNERENVREIASRLAAVMSRAGISHEVVFVDDDSPDGTWREVELLARERPEVRLVHRIGRKGLSSAAFEGMLTARGEFVAVMDGDLQHDESILPEMLARTKAGADIAIGSRYCGDASVGAWAQGRRKMSRLATVAARGVIPQNVTDPLSGFFVCRTALAREAARRVSQRGFKLLAEILGADPRLTAVEVPYTFRSRRAGDSKMSAPVVEEYLVFLYGRSLGRFVDLRFAKYCVVGLAGALASVAALTVCWKGLGLSFGLSVALGTELAIVCNFLLNNRWTFRDHLASGRAAFLVFLRYQAVCVVGALASYSITVTLYDHAAPWLVAAPVGGFVGALWNYAMAKTFAWRVG